MTKLSSDSRYIRAMIFPIANLRHFWENPPMKWGDVENEDKEMNNSERIFIKLSIHENILHITIE